MIFGSCLRGWAFTIKQFAEIYADKFKIEVGKLVKRLWGDQFYDPKERKWSKTEAAGSVRGFCQFILDPIFKVRMKRRETLNFLNMKYFSRCMLSEICPD